MFKRIILILTVCLINITHSQVKTDTLKCNGNVLLKFAKSIDSLDTKIAKELF